MWRDVLWRSNTFYDPAEGFLDTDQPQPFIENPRPDIEWKEQPELIKGQPRIVRKSRFNVWLYVKYISNG